MTRSIPSSLDTARKWMIAIGLLGLVAGGFSLLLGSLGSSEVDRAANGQLRDLGWLLLAMALAMFLVAWGLGRAQPWALVLGVLIETASLVSSVGSLLGGFSGRIAIRALLALYLLNLLLRPESLAAVGLWRSRPAPPPAPSDPQSGYQPPARW